METMADDGCTINKIINDTFFHGEEGIEEEEETTTDIQYDDENTGIAVAISQIAAVERDVQLETPLEATHGVSLTTADSSNVKPKRLSDEFSSIDDETEVACCSKASSIQEHDDMDESSSNPAYICDKAETSSSCISLCFSNSSNNIFVQSIDAIEREDFENEQKLTGGIIIRASSLAGTDDRLNFDLINRRSAENNEINGTSSTSQNVEASNEAPSSSLLASRNELTSTPTSSRNATNNSADSRNKSTIRSSSAKQKLSDKYLSIMQNVAGSSRTDYNGESSKSVVKENDDDDVVEPEELDLGEEIKQPEHSRRGEKNIRFNLFDDEPSTSSGRHHNSPRNNRMEDNDDCIKINDYIHNNHDHLQLNDEVIDHEHDEDTWADCEEGSDSEEVCTCQVFTDDEGASSSSEDELPSRDVDLSSYTQLDSMSDEILQESTDGTPKVPRKRKLTDCSQSSISIHPTESPISLGGNRKRLALETVSSPHSSMVLTPMTSQTIATPKSTGSILGDKRTPRLIPTKENPPPELMEWLLQFQRWTNAERIVALDKLIEHCEPTQVRHMMKVIEPQFQRDFISLLPKELALHVLSYLEPKDLLRAAQTCRSWRFLADDNLLWKEKCKQSGIITATDDKPKRGRTGNMPKIASPWKAAYMRHHTIETNWRSNPIRTPKVLNGHDDHVITCLQFCGNRIVSGSDDNTLKVWSAVTGKCLRTLIGHTGGVWSSQMAGNLIISGSTDRTLKVWDADTGACKHTLYGHTSTVRCMHLHGNK